MNINKRAKMVRKTLGLTLEKFGEPLGVKKAAVSSWENERTSLTKQIAKSICREFGVNPEWLNNGIGDMFVEPAIDDAYLVSELLENGDDEFYQAVLELIRTYNQLSPSGKKVLCEVGNKYIENIKNRKK